MSWAAYGVDADVGNPSASAVVASVAGVAGDIVDTAREQVQSKDLSPQFATNAGRAQGVTVPGRREHRNADNGIAIHSYSCIDARTTPPGRRTDEPFDPLRGRSGPPTQDHVA